MFKKTLLLAATGALVSVLSLSASATIVPDAPRINAKGYVLMDYQSGKIIAANNENERLAPASLTKIMTSYVLGQEINAGRISMDDTVTVSEKAWASNFPGSSLMFIEAGEKIRLEDLNRGLVIQSGNDASVALAEHVAGSEGAFVQLMNSWAQRLGMDTTLFTNAHGLDSDGKYTTAKDMATLSRALIRDVPQEYALYSERAFTWDGIEQTNRNKLLWDRSLNVDGIKTGYTSEAGYSLITSATEDDMRLITVVMGAESDTARMEETRKLLRYGFRFFATTQLLESNQAVASARVWKGASDKVPAGVTEDFFVTLPGGQAESLQRNYQLNPGLEAPIAIGDTIGSVQWLSGEEVVVERPLLALEQVEKGGFLKRFIDGIRLFFNSLVAEFFG